MKEVQKAKGRNNLTQKKKPIRPMVGLQTITTKTKKVTGYNNFISLRQAGNKCFSFPT